jgi:hypothetical protein
LSFLSANLKKIKNVNFMFSIFFFEIHLYKPHVLLEFAISAHVLGRGNVNHAKKAHLLMFATLQ